METLIPDKLYYYTTSITALKILDDNRIKYSDIKDLNDPFDCKISTIVSFSSPYNLPSINKSCELDELKDRRNKWGLVSLSIIPPTNDESYLLWSHYADSHKGVCLSLDMNKICNLIDSFLYPIVYLKNSPKITTPSQPHIESDLIKFAKDILFTKSKHWEYEKEWRIIKFFDKSELYKNPPEWRFLNLGDSIDEIYLGCQIDNKEKVLICESIDKNIKYKNSNISQMIKNEYNYNLTYIKIK